MNIKLVLKILPFLLIFQVFNLFAQESSTSNSKKSKTIIDELNSKQAFQGDVTVYQDEAIRDILNRSTSANLPVYSSADGTVQYTKMRGYKIQVFSGNNQRKSKDEAYAKEKLINDKFDDLETVVYFNSPRWILRAGNFRTREEANSIMQEIMKQFPSFGKEMYIISDTVKIPL